MSDITRTLPHVVIYRSRPDGHAKVLVDLIEMHPSFVLTGLIDDHEENRSRRVRGLAVVGTGDDLDQLQAEGSVLCSSASGPARDGSMSSSGSGQLGCACQSSYTRARTGRKPGRSETAFRSWSVPTLGPTPPSRTVHSSTLMPLSSTT